MELLVAFHFRKIITIEQPVNLLSCNGNHFFPALWPLEFFLSEYLIVENEACGFPLQTL